MAEQVDGGTGPEQDVNTKAAAFAKRHGSFDLHFDAGQNYVGPDDAPWTLHLDSATERGWGGFTAGEALDFAAAELAKPPPTSLPQQVVLDLKWTEGGQERRELFGPWTQGDPETEEGGLSHMVAAHAFMREWASAHDPDLACEATVILVNDPEEWLRAREQKHGDDASSHP